MPFSHQMPSASWFCNHPGGHWPLSGWPQMADKLYLAWWVARCSGMNYWTTGCNPYHKYLEISSVCPWKFVSKKHVSGSFSNVTYIWSALLPQEPVQVLWFICGDCLIVNDPPRCTVPESASTVKESLFPNIHTSTVVIICNAAMLWWMVPAAGVAYTAIDKSTYWLVPVSS